MVCTRLEEERSTDLIQEGQRALSRHQESSSTKGGVIRPKKKQKKKKEMEASHKEPEGLQPSQKRVQEEKREKKAYPEQKKEGIGNKDLKSKEKRLEKQKDKTSDRTKKGPSAPLYSSLREFHSNNSYSALSGDEEKSSEEESSLEDLEGSSSSESSLDPEEDEELEEEAARYEEERYGHRRLRSSGAMAAPCSPSAPPPYSGVGRSHFIKGKIWSRLAAAFPVFENSVTQERVYEPVSYKQLKDLMEAVKTYGVTATYTTALLRRLTVNAMTPTDWYEVARTCLNHGQFLDFRSIVLDKAQAQYRKNVQDGRADWTVDMLLGQGLHAVDQTNYPFEVYRQVNEIFYQSWRAIPNKGEITGNLNKIIQAAAEPFSDYVARMLDTAERGEDPIWVPRRLTRILKDASMDDDVPDEPVDVLDEPTAGEDGAKMGDPVSVSEFDASPA
ncbi:hypothetical protein STEG23_017684 [Scotinomys teguina]